MDTLVVRAYIRQLRRQMEDMNYTLGELEKLIESPEYWAKYYHSKASGIAYEALELNSTRTLFNRIFRGLQRQLGRK